MVEDWRKGEEWFGGGSRHLLFLSAQDGFSNGFISSVTPASTASRLTTVSSSHRVILASWFQSLHVFPLFLQLKDRKDFLLLSTSKVVTALCLTLSFRVLYRPTRAPLEMVSVCLVLYDYSSAWTSSLLWSHKRALNNWGRKTQTRIESLSWCRLILTMDIGIERNVCFEFFSNVETNTGSTFLLKCQIESFES